MKNNYLGEVWLWKVSL